MFEIKSLVCECQIVDLDTIMIVAIWERTSSYNASRRSSWCNLCLLCC